VIFFEENVDTQELVSEFQLIIINWFDAVNPSFS